MDQTVVIFTEKITNRIEYIFDFIFSDFLGLKYEIVISKNIFDEYNGPKINFSNQFLEHEINFNVDEILLENDIKTTTNYSTLNEFGKCFYWLSRYEEYIAEPYLFDKHQRFLGSDLDYSKPIVDLICMEIKKKISIKHPQLIFKERVFEQINTHDVDYAWKYLHHSPKIKIGSIAKKLLKANFREAQKQVNVWLGKEKDPYATFDYLKDLARKYDVKTVFFWLLGDYSTFDKNHDWKNKNQKELINDVARWATIGIHSSYESNKNVNLLQTEINRLELLTNKSVKKSRQHFIKLNFPQTYQQLLKSGILEDYTMGFANRIGFRAGTSTPYKWFDLSTNEQTLLITYPFVAMDVTLKNYMKLTTEEAIDELKQLKNTIKSVNGTFITLFHQSNLDEDWIGWRKVYESIFE